LRAGVGAHQGALGGYPHRPSPRPGAGHQPSGLAGRLCRGARSCPACRRGALTIGAGRHARRTHAAAAGPERYAAAAGILASPLAQLVLFGTVFSFCYHLLNGVRHLFFDMGHGFELQTARRSGWAVAIAAIVLGLVVWFVVRAGLGGAA